MKNFNNCIDVQNKQHFKKYLLTRVTCYLRRDIFDHILINSENNYFDLTNFFGQYRLDEHDQVNIVIVVTKELEAYGWHCKTSFGGTGLFIYSDTKPVNCWEDGFE
jgi:hypothetical protein